ncbi:MAG: synthase subunit c [Bacillales bacterium]|jgi:F-type H+-transporting ATPase subunit c|nr:synthase subunit c [Bacillales bacterium]
MSGLVMAGIVACVAAFSAAFSNMMMISKTLDSVARQPEAAPMLRNVMFVGMAAIEAVPIITVVIAFILMNK